MHWRSPSRPRRSLVSDRRIRRSLTGHLRPFMPQKTRVGNDRSQSTTDVARRRNRNEKLYKAGARSSVTLAAQNADRRAAVSEIELALSTLSRHTRRTKAVIQLRSRRRTKLTGAVTAMILSRASDHSITSSARSRNASGIDRPSALAVVRLMTSSNLDGCSTGISPGFVPRRILSTNSAARRN